MRLRGLDAEVLVHARQLLHAAVEQHEVVHQLEQPRLGAHLQQVLVELEAAVVGLVFLPLQEVLLRRADGAVLQPLGVVARKDELHRAEEPGVELGCWFDRFWRMPSPMDDAAVLQLEHAHRDAVDVQHEVGLRSCPPRSVTSSAMAKSFFSGRSQSMSLTVSVTLPASVFTGTP
jgi:hypothetical protein